MRGISWIFRKLRSIPLLLIRIYQRGISPFLGNNCRFTPTCSEYAFVAIERFGFLRGSWLALRRICRCAPWHPGGYDPVPPREDEKKNCPDDISSPRG